MVRPDPDIEAVVGVGVGEAAVAGVGVGEAAVTGVGGGEVGGGEGEFLNVTLCVLCVPGVVGGAVALDLLVADMASARLNVLREASSSED